MCYEGQKHSRQQDQKHLCNQAAHKQGSEALRQILHIYTKRIAYILFTKQKRQLVGHDT